MSERLLDISTLLAEYSQGNFDFRVRISDDLDEIDSIISGINMLGEELKETTVSRDFFSGVYNNVTNYIFIVDAKGIIIDCNKTFEQVFGSDCRGQSFTNYLNDLDIKLLEQKINERDFSYTFETEIHRGAKVLFFSCAITQVLNQDQKSYIFVLEDITEKKETEKRILRAIMQTEELERKRLADDLHDSLGQRLSSIKILLGLAKSNTKKQEPKEFIETSIELLETSIHELRGVCFDLMPTALERGGLCSAIEQLIQKNPFDIKFKTNVQTLDLDRKKEIAIYRVIQEFINNSIKHSKGTKINIKIVKSPEKAEIVLSDDGVGFDMETKAKDSHDGRGLNTMRSRIESYGGKYQLKATMGKGVELKISF
jgi:PAS domain S-box-containing protein